MSSTPEFNAEQLASVRAAHWHHSGDALLTLEAAREWIGELGLVLFAPRPHQLAAPAASLVEATLGRVAEAPTAAETETARGLVARLVAEGTALPLNLLGGPGDQPDFVASAQVFSYVFTLRGDKAWKQPPGTSGSVSVSPLAAKVYGVLAERGALTAAELVSELGRELTENAIARALSELWIQLRVIPLLQQDGAATMWELTSRRFTKAIKSGANAGQPTALSALVSLYLTQAYAATEDEIETFLSPLAPRSRVRDVLHGLSAGRQLEPVVLEGKTLLYIPGALPEFPEIAKPEPEQAVEPMEEGAEPVGERRIRSFAARSEKGREFRGRPEQRGPQQPRREGGLRPPRRMAERQEERRPYRDRQAGDRQGFTRPWEEERRPKGREGEERPERPRFEGASRPERSRFERADRPERARFERTNRPVRPRPEGEAGERKPFRPRKFEGDREGARPGGFRGRPERREDRGKRPFERRSEGGERPKRPFERRSEAQGGERPQRPFRPRQRQEEGAGGSARGGEYKRDNRPGFGGPKRGYTPRGTEEGGRPAAKRPFRPRPEGGAPSRPRTEGGGAAKKGFGPKRFGEGARGKFGGKPGAKFGGKPGTKFGGKPGAKFGGKPGGKFGGRAGGSGPKRGGPPAGERPRRPEAEE